ncbi:MAG: hypothetical protein ACRD5I_01450 [Candidatus Acidiferrales bacterium]
MRPNLRRAILVGASFGALAVVGALMPAEKAATQGMMSPLLVEVTNTPTVNAQQSGSWHVGIDGQVEIGNPAGRPLPVRDVENPAHSVFKAALACTISINEGICLDTFSVPGNKLLVIETLSVITNSPAGSTPRATLEFQPPSGPAEEHFLPPLQLWHSSGVDNHVLLSSVRLYAEPGSAVFFRLFRDPQPQVTLGGMKVTGYLVECGPGSGCPIP